MDTLLTLPPLARAAFLLDLDGTLLDIAPAPDQVVVAPGLVDNLRRLRLLCGGALAIVTGRPIAQVDALLGDAPFAVAGEHGTSIRHAAGEPPRAMAMPALPEAWREAAGELAAQYPGALLEPKSHGLVLHYRAVPEAGAALRDELIRLLETQPGSHVLMPAKMAWEIRPASADKGTAVRALMAQAPFRGRIPVFVGDDVTDEDGMREARALGGIGLRVPDAFGEPADVRAWIAALAAQERPRPA
jgi:trehalose 6-phosphate phosphatase